MGHDMTDMTIPRQQHSYHNNRFGAVDAVLATDPHALRSTICMRSYIRTNICMYIYICIYIYYLYIYIHVCTHVFQPHSEARSSQGSVEANLGSFWVRLFCAALPQPRRKVRGLSNSGSLCGASVSHILRQKLGEGCSEPITYLLSTH